MRWVLHWIVYVSLVDPYLLFLVVVISVQKLCIGASDSVVGCDVRSRACVPVHVCVSSDVRVTFIFLNLYATQFQERVEVLPTLASVTGEIDAFESSMQVVLRLGSFWMPDPGRGEHLCQSVARVSGASPCAASVIDCAL